MKIPSSFAAGDTLSWTDSVALYPAGQGYTLHYALLKAGTQIVIDSTASGDDHKISVAVSATTGYVPGDYDWTAYVTKGSGGTAERYTVGNGRVTILPNLVAQNTGYDNRSQARKILESLLAAYQIAVTTRAFVYEYQIAGRKMMFNKKDEWILEINYWKAEVAKEERQAAIANGKSPANRLLVRF